MRLYGMLLLLMSVAVGFSIPCDALAADDGAKVFTESCAPCHTPKMRSLDNTHMTRDQWKDTVDRMLDQGAEVPKGKIPALLDYLVSTHGPVGAAPAEGRK